MKDPAANCCWCHQWWAHLSYLGLYLYEGRHFSVKFLHVFCNFVKKHIMSWVFQTFFLLSFYMYFATLSPTSPWRTIMAPHVLQDEAKKLQPTKRSEGPGEASILKKFLIMKTFCEITSSCPECLTLPLTYHQSFTKKSHHLGPVSLSFTLFLWLPALQITVIWESGYMTTV